MAAPPNTALVIVASEIDDRRGRIVELIERAGMRAFEALDGVQALAVGVRYIPDVVIADAMLPHMDGPRLLAALKHNHDTREVPVIILREAAPNAENLVEEVQHLLAPRTSALQATLTLRRALADIRAVAGDAPKVDAAEAKARAHQIANGATESMISVLIADDDARYVEANAAICALSGYSREDLVQMHIWDLAATHRVEEGRRIWERFKRKGRFEGSYQIRRRTGERVTIRCASSANVVPGLHASTMAPPRLLEVIRS